MQSKGIATMLSRLAARLRFNPSGAGFAAAAFVGLLSCAPIVQAQQVPADWWVDIENDRAGKIGQELARGLADPNALAPEGRPALMRAVAAGAWKTFDVLLADKRTDVNAEDPLGETPLMYTALAGDMARSQALLARGAQVNKLGWTPLHYAASKGQLEIVRMLLARDAMPNAPSPTGVTPLMMAAYANSRPTVQLLLAAGADPLARDEKGQDAADWAEQGKAGGLAQELRTLVAQRLQTRRQTGHDAATQTLPAQAPAAAAQPAAPSAAPATPDGKPAAGTHEVQGVSGLKLGY
jgi:hypothetical protein